MRRLLRRFNPLTSLSGRISLTFTLFFVVQFLIYNSVASRQASNTFVRLTLAEIQARSETATNTISNFIVIRQNMLQIAIALAEGNLGPLALYLPRLVEREPVFQELVVLDLAGQLIGRAGSGEEVLGNSFTAQQSAWYAQAKQGQTYLSRLQISPQGQPYVILAEPIEAGNAQRGVIAARLDMRVLWDTVMAFRISDGGQAYVVDENGLLIAHRDAQWVLEGFNVTDTDIARVLMADTETVQEFTGLNGVMVYGNAQIVPGTLWRVITEVPQATVLAPRNELLIALGWIASIAILLTQLVGGGLAAQIARPVQALTRAAEHLAAGEFNARAPVTTRDEIGHLAQAFNHTAEQLTQTLRALEARSHAQAASAAISHNLATLLDPDQLLRRVVEEVQKAFAYYHVHLFLLETTGHMLESAASADDSPSIRIPEKLRIPINNGLIGRAFRARASVVAPDITAEPDYVPHQALPDTRAALAVPLVVSGEVVGVLSVEERRPNSLTAADAEVLQGIANQVGLALQNARAYAQTQRRADRETQLNRLSQTLQNAITIESVLSIAAREIGQTLSVPQVTVKLGLPNRSPEGRA
jgi:GAF domain-containing protein/HAMP domain-containing protein